MRNSIFTYIDLFAGCGGLSLGLRNAGWKGVFAIEKSPDAFNTLNYNLIEKINHFDWPNWLPIEAHDINVVLKKYSSYLKELKGKIDLIAGGPPCQGFSTAGRRKEDDSRNKLIDSYLKFIEFVKPKVIFFENVKGFTLEFKSNKSKGRKYSNYVIKKLEDLNYSVHGELINFSEYGIPQKRTRFILVGIDNDYLLSKGQEVLFFEKLRESKVNFLLNKGLSLDIKLEEAISDLLFQNGRVICPDNSNFYSGYYSEAVSPYQKYMRKGIESKIPDSHRFVNHKGATIKKFSEILNIAGKSKSLNSEIKSHFNIKKHTIIPLDGNDYSTTLTTLPDDYLHYLEPRILTVREYARIQSFPDSFKFRGKYTTGGKLRTQEIPRYSQVGNAIPPLFGEQTGMVLKQLISR
jgi:DNA (cytosine-5)-methyltransferase 1